MRIIYFVLRLLACPFILGLSIVILNFHAIKRTILFLMYGGEFITYQSKMNKHTIQDVYLKIVEQQERKV